MRQDCPALLRGKGELGFIINTQVACVSCCKTIHSVLAKNCGKRNGD